MIKSKKLSSLVAASLILAGGSFLGVQTVSADDDTRLDTRLGAVEALASQNSSSISKLEETVNKISTTPEQLQQIATNKDNIAANKDSITKIQKDLNAANLKDMSETAANLKNYDSQMSTVQALATGNKKNIDQNTTDIATNKDNIAANKDAINKEVQDRTKAVADEAKARAEKDTAHDTAIAANKDAINKEVQDRTKAVADEAKARAEKDTAHDTAIAANKDAINKEVRDRTNAVTDEAAARESGDNALQNQIKKESAARQADISRLDNKIHDVSKEVDTVGALSMAMSGLHPLSYDEGDARFQLSAAVGTYDGTEALALGGFYHFNRDSMLSVGVATDLGADEHRMGANVGYTRRIGQGGHVSRPSEGTVSDIMKDIKNLEQKQAKLEQENEQLKQQLAALKK